MLVIFSLKNVRQGHKLELTYLHACMLAVSCIWRAVKKYQNGTAKVAKRSFNMGRSGTQHVAMVTELLASICLYHAPPYWHQNEVKQAADQSAEVLHSHDGKQRLLQRKKLSFQFIFEQKDRKSFIPQNPNTEPSENYLETIYQARKTEKSHGRWNTLCKSTS